MERRRNTLGVDQLFINISHPLAAKILTFWERNKDHPKLQRAKVRTLINPRFRLKCADFFKYVVYILEALFKLALGLFYVYSLDCHIILVAVME